MNVIKMVNMKNCDLDIFGSPLRRLFVVSNFANMLVLTGSHNVEFKVLYWACHDLFAYNLHV